ncbi:hypothetical protein Q0M94_10790 [Deinococcus radiomollis]|uniref:hypothetical protein n=1 Tax=Deinococcus radiomollis TaxID=468916 RepID=UPI0038925A29
MPTYSEWNTALIEHVTEGAPTGSTVYLESSDETLLRVGVQRWGQPAGQGGWRGDFLAAVQENSVWKGRVATEWMLATDNKSRPVGVAFLSAMVLAASQMATDAGGTVHERNYFRRLSDVLGVPLDSQGRPPGLAAGTEEPLWQAWLAYLQRRGLNSTARGGEGPRRFISYPISQTLIPEGERQRLRRLFVERAYPLSWDGDTLASHLRGDGVPSTKLRELLSRTGLAADDVQHALLDVFQSHHLSLLNGTMQDGEYAAAVGVRHLMAGLYRSEHWRTGDPEYQLFPRQPRGVRRADLSVNLQQGPIALVFERPGYFHAVGEVTPSELTSGANYPVTGSPFVDTLMLPAREFWMLREDPDAQGMYASLGTPGVGEHMLLVLKETLLGDVERFRDEGLLAWKDRPEPLGNGWLELHELMVVGNHWHEVTAGTARALYEALRPPGGMGIHLEGGVRAQRAGAYLEGAPPTVRVMSFSMDTYLTVYRDQEEVYTSSVRPGDVLDVPIRQPGAYELIVEARGVTASRLLTVLSWDALKARVLPDEFIEGTEVNGCRILGAQIFG